MGHPIFAALASKSDDAVRALLKARAAASPPDSPLHGLCEEYCQNTNRKAEFYRGFVFSRQRCILSYIAESGDEILASIFLALNECDVDAKDYSGPTPLYLAVSNSHEAMVRLLLESGADVDDAKVEAKVRRYGGPLKDRHDGVAPLLPRDTYTPLCWAVYSGDEAIVRLLLERGADVKAKDTAGRTALFWAADKGYEAVMRLLLERGADIDAKDSLCHRPLRRAADSGHVAIVRLLLERGADIDAKDIAGWTALLWAADQGHEVVVRLLLERGADVDAKEPAGRTALLWAADQGHEVVVRLLLERGADVDAKDTAGRTALLWAVDQGARGRRAVAAREGCRCRREGYGWPDAAEAGRPRQPRAVVRLLLQHTPPLQTSTSPTT